RKAIDETERRRAKQIEFNRKHDRRYKRLPFSILLGIYTILTSRQRSSLDRIFECIDREKSLTSHLFASSTPLFRAGSFLSKISKNRQL
ncbi:hypothetical protein, partial [Acinetobacter baumannii]|uniref:hypothetical protein n=1 Tax=Acinetobacter baumannii TaxID=470 RepID=UPI00344D0D25